MLLRLLDVLVCLSVTPCATLSWFSMSSLLANCSLVYSMLTHVLRVVCWTDQSLCTSLSCSGDQPERGHERASRVFCFGLCGRLPPKLLEQSSALVLFRCCGHRRAGRVPRGQWALLDTDMLVLIDRSACLVEPSLHLCSSHQVLAPHGPLTVFRREPHRGVFAPRSFGTVLSLALRDLDLLLDDLSLSSHFQLGRSASRLICQLDRSSHRRQLLLLCMLFARQLRFTRSHLFLGPARQRRAGIHLTLCTLTWFSTN